MCKFLYLLIFFCYVAKLILQVEDTHKVFIAQNYSIFVIY